MPVDETAFHPPAADLPRDELLFVGRLDRQKGAEIALRAVAELRGAAASLPLRLVGDGPAREGLRRLATELGLTDRIRWQRQLPQAELADRYQRAVALLVPGQDEGLGLAAVEAQLSATPVIAAASGGLLDVVADGQTGLTFPPGQPTALARAVETLLADPSTAARLADAGRRSAARFTTKAAARAYAAVYAEVLQPARRT
jgi:D-inositol-3-phosphate glycosyltransferase